MSDCPSTGDARSTPSIYDHFTSYDEDAFFEHVTGLVDQVMVGFFSADRSVFCLRAGYARAREVLEAYDAQHGTENEVRMPFHAVLVAVEAARPKLAGSVPAERLQAVAEAAAVCAAADMYREELELRWSREDADAEANADASNEDND